MVEFLSCTHMIVVGYDNVSGRIHHVRWEVDEVIMFDAWDAAGREDIVELHHAEWFTTEMFHLQRLTGDKRQKINNKQQAEFKDLKWGLPPGYFSMYHLKMYRVFHKHLWYRLTFCDEEKQGIPLNSQPERHLQMDTSMIFGFIFYFFILFFFMDTSMRQVSYRPYQHGSLFR